MVINQGLGGPKANPKGVVDGQLVNIPTLEYVSNRLRNVVILAANWISVLGSDRKVRVERIWYLYQKSK